MLTQMLPPETLDLEKISYDINSNMSFYIKTWNKSDFGAT